MDQWPNYYLWKSLINQCNFQFEYFIINSIRYYVFEPNFQVNLSFKNYFSNQLFFDYDYDCDCYCD